MPEHTAAERQKKRQNKSAAAIAANDASEQSTSTTNNPAPAAKAAPKEKVGTGRNDSESNFKRLSAGLRKKIAAASASGNTALAERLAVRLVELRKITDQAN